MEHENINEYPWLLVKIHGATYVVNSQHITTISKIPDVVTVIPNQPAHIRGAIQYAKESVNLIDTRQVLGVMPFEQENAEFVEMLATSKEDHINWINELERCVNENDEFLLATDPHKCKFGMWYDRYDCLSKEIDENLKMVVVPHEKLHKVAIKVMDILKGTLTDEEKKVKAMELVTDAKERYVKEILAILDVAKRIQEAHSTEMIIVFEAENNYYSIIVDEVLSVDEIELLTGQNINNAVFKTDLVYGIALTKKTRERVLLLDYNKFD